MAAPQLISKIYVLPNSGFKGTVAAVNVSGSSAIAAKTGTQARITSISPIKITINNAPSGTYVSISVAAGSQSIINYNRLGTTPTLYHIIAKTGDDTVMVLTAFETTGAVDAVDRTWAIGGPFSDFTDAGKVAYVTSGYDKVLCSNEGGADWVPAAAIALTNSSTAAQSIANGNIIYEGYGIVDGDKGLFVINANLTANIFTVASSFINVNNIHVKGVKVANRGISYTGNYGTFNNCIVSSPQAGATGNLWYCGGTGVWLGCCADGGGIGVIGFNQVSGMHVFVGCVSRKCANNGYLTSTTSITLYVRCIASKNSSGAGYGWSVNTNARFIGCIANGNSQSGVYVPSASADQMSAINCIFSNNGGYGWEKASPTTGYQPFIVACDFWANTLGSSNSICNCDPPDGVINFAINPLFYDQANENYMIGALLKAKGFPSILPGGVTLPVLVGHNYEDIGVLQREESGFPRNRIVQEI